MRGEQVYLTCKAPICWRTISSSGSWQCNAKKKKKKFVSLFQAAKLPCINAYADYFFPSIYWLSDNSVRSGFTGRCSFPDISAFTQAFRSIRLSGRYCYYPFVVVTTSKEKFKRGKTTNVPCALPVIKKFAINLASLRGTEIRVFIRKTPHSKGN